MLLKLNNMSSVEDIDAQIAEYERKIQELEEQRKIIKFKEFVGEKDLKRMKDIQLEVSYQYRESDEDEYAHWTNAKLNVKHTEPLCILIGPEGDFTEKEREKILKLKNIIPLKINENILRSETAAISIISVIAFKLLS